jgi:PIN domain nuclease of toxin-antitoxin system
MEFKVTFANGRQTYVDADNEKELKSELDKLVKTFGSDVSKVSARKLLTKQRKKLLVLRKPVQENMQLEVSQNKPMELTITHLVLRSSHTMRGVIFFLIQMEWMQ